MEYLRILILVSVLTVETIQQKAVWKCETSAAFDRPFYTPDTFVSFGGFGSKCTFENVKSLDDLTQLNSLTSRGKQQVGAILFINSSLSKLPDKMFEGFIGIKTLDASRMAIGEIATRAFFDVKSWSSIDLSNNQIRRLDERTFATLQITNLDLSMNLIETIDEKAFTSASVNKLNLSFNKLKSMGFVSSFTFFDAMILNDNLIESFKIEVDEEKWKSRSRFTLFEKPDFFLQNNKFQIFSCTSNIAIEQITLENNPALTEIALNRCDVDKLTVSKCAKLKKISCNDNLLTLDASNLMMNEIDLSTATSLRTLLMKNSSLNRPVIESILKMENLTFLDLSYNNIGPLNTSTFAKLKSLQFLSLKATNISNIKFGTFSHQHKMNIFDLSDNHLGFFDMNMIFSMVSLLSLDVSGNDLTMIENINSAHNIFAMLQKIDLSDNKFPCSYLMKLINIFRVYKVALATSKVEESGTNVHGNACIHVEGDDDVIQPLSQDNSNITEVREKLNELIAESGKNSQFKINVEARLNRLETKIDNQITSSALSASLTSDKSQHIEVRNSGLLETALIVVCICCVAFVVMKSFIVVKNNFLGRPQRMQASSERHLAMSVDDF